MTSSRISSDARRRHDDAPRTTWRHGPPAPGVVLGVTLAALGPALWPALWPAQVEAQEAAAATPPATEDGAEAGTEAGGADAPAGLAADEDPARGEGEEEAVVRTPTPLNPVDAWREDPTVVLSAVDVDLEQFRWVARPVVVFADTPADPAFQQQLTFLTARMEALAARDVVILTDTDPEALSDLRRRLRPRGFMLAVLGKDGGVKLRKPFPWDVRELTRTIDKMPLRQQELRDARDPNL